MSHLRWMFTVLYVKYETMFLKAADRLRQESLL